jgi:group I intron endonuclease
MADAILCASGIYAIRNTVNGKRYVGSAVFLNQRLKQHRSDLNRDRHCNIKLSSAWKKHGADAFTFEVIEYVHDKSCLILREQHWIDHYKSAFQNAGYNINPVAGSSLGQKRSRESVEKTAEKLRGKKRPTEVGEKISASKIGTKRTEEQKLQMSIAAKNRRAISDATRAKLSASAKGRKHSEKTKRLLSEQRIGIKLSDSHCARISEVQKGRKQSPESVKKRMASNAGFRHTKEAIEKMRNRVQSKETRIKLSLAHTGKKMSDEARANMCIAAKKRWEVRRGINN